VNDQAARQQAIDRALELNPNFVDALYEKGLLEYDQGRFEEGIELMARAIEADPTVDPSVFHRGLDAIRAGDGAAARSFFACALANDSDQGRIHLCLATNFHRERMFEEAAEEYRIATELMPRYADVHGRYGQVLLELGRNQDAVAALRRAVEINPRYVQAHAYLAVALLRSRQNEQAKAEVEKALDLDPGNPIALSAARRLKIA
jgi:Tfp pilus assembly protein PilF